MGWVERHFGKRRKCWLSAFSPFPTMFSKNYLSRAFKRRDCEVNGSNQHIDIFVLFVFDYFYIHVGSKKGFCLNVVMHQEEGKSNFRSNCFINYFLQTRRNYCLEDVQRSLCSSFLENFHERKFFFVFVAFFRICFFSHYVLILCQTTNFRLFQTRRFCRQQFKI